MKKTIVCLLLALTLCLSACAETYTPDEFVLRFGEVFIERLQERLENFDPTNTEPLDPDGGSSIEYPAIAEHGPADDVVTFDGGSVKLETAMEEYLATIAMYEEFDMDPYEFIDDLKESVLYNLAEQAVLEMKAKELGVYESTPEELAAAEEEALYWYEDNLAYYMGMIDDGSLSDEDLRAAAEELMIEEGASYENLLESTLYSLWLDRLYEAITAEVTVSEETLQTAYETGVSDAMQMYSDAPELFEYDYFYGLVYYRPAGFREVEFMELAYSDEEYDLPDDEKLARLTERCAESIARTQNCESLLDAMDNTECRDFGTLAVSKDSTLMPEVFTKAAMALAEGETSAPIPSDSGAWIIRCIRNIEPGEVPYEEIHDMLAETLLGSAKSEFYYQQVQDWMDEANVVFHPEMLP